MRMESPTLRSAAVVMALHVNFVMGLRRCTVEVSSSFKVNKFPLAACRHLRHCVKLSRFGGTTIWPTCVPKRIGVFSLHGPSRLNPVPVSVTGQRYQNQRRFFELALYINHQKCFKAPLRQLPSAGSLRLNFPSFQIVPTS
ncbi:hypothetical protein BJ322DRAFT_491906 [Thelephora terrestris]|uniref:Secreted protein n=1 Tax=Thelephora terrestris TaxID=56493 RepID=A0A9P6L233_9AGAM|nr:hypothetical protein BJ322DRAFT_491906 [Thelephora terrestris]